MPPAIPRSKTCSVDCDSAMYRPFKKAMGSTISSRLRHWAPRPGIKLLVANPLRFAFGLLASCDSNHFLKNLASYLLDRRAVQDGTGIDVHVVDHPIVHRSIGGNLHRRD